MKLTFKSRFNQIALSTFVFAGLLSTPLLSLVTVQPDAAHAQAKQGRLRIAVLDFDNGSTGISLNIFSAVSNDSAAKGVSNLVAYKLVRTGNYTVLERGQVDKILKEQDLGQAGRIEAGTAAKLGKVLGVDAVLVGSITRFNVEQKKSGFNVGGLFGSGSKKSKAIVQLNGRLVSAQTGEILAVGEGSGEASQKDSSTQVFGIGGGSETDNLDTLLSTAADKAVEQMLSQLTGSMKGLSATK
jgi:curli biogenesis system outer membrane secretion channel CsgG